MTRHQRRRLARMWDAARKVASRAETEIRWARESAESAGDTPSWESYLHLLTRADWDELKRGFIEAIRERVASRLETIDKARAAVSATDPLVSGGGDANEHASGGG